MARSIRISAPALRWLEAEAERIATDLGAGAARQFVARIDEALNRIAAFPAMTERGKIAGTRTIVVNKRTILTLVERNGELVVAAARSHRQEDAHDPHEAYGDDIQE